ncbi:MAG: glucans biosynthesis glucosyltransferase MdoH [Xanthobacteraceae bacterium]
MGRRRPRPGRPPGPRLRREARGDSRHFGGDDDRGGLRDVSRFGGRRTDLGGARRTRPVCPPVRVVSVLDRLGFHRLPRSARPRRSHPRHRPLGAVADLSSRTALLLPTYNEDARRLMSRLQAIYESVEATGQGDRFDFFVLSDTTDPDIWIAEEIAFFALREQVGETRLFYRRRAENTERKAGNIGEWVTGFGGRYAQMIVLDADSLMTGDTVVRLAAAMEAHPHVGLIQTFPVIVNGTTLFQRLQQFAGRVYGPLIAHGIAWWHGGDSNYWGHNAIIRNEAFAAFAGLPRLDGRKPIGGHILSHDFVEAALIRRGGYTVHIAPMLSGSYEEMPPSLTDYAIRDRRWCQGNLQHLGVLPARGLHWMSRLHLLTGIGSYITAPLWFVFLIVGILISLQAQFVRPEYFRVVLPFFRNGRPRIRCARPWSLPAP